MIKLYESSVFKLCVIMMEIDFEKVDEILGNVESDIAALREHVGEVERTIRILNDCWIGIVNTLPYSYLPSQITIQLIYFYCNVVECTARW